MRNLITLPVFQVRFCPWSRLWAVSGKVLGFNVLGKGSSQAKGAEGVWMWCKPAEVTTPDHWLTLEIVDLEWLDLYTSYQLLTWCWVWTNLGKGFGFKRGACFSWGKPWTIWCADWTLTAVPAAVATGLFWRRACKVCPSIYHRKTVDCSQLIMKSLRNGSESF